MKMVHHTINDTIKLARAFGEQIQGALSVTEFRAMIDANKAEGWDGPVCHTHDYCDANVYMEAAFVEAMGREPALLDEEIDADNELWNDAWVVAKAADFFA